MINFTDVKDKLEAASYVATIFGIIVAVFVFWSEKRKERRDREIEAYARSNDRYIHYLTLCLEHPQANSFDPDTTATGVPAPRLIMFSILISVFETAYLSLRNASTQLRRRQWHGWENYIRMWSKQEDFAKTWDTIGSDFDLEFQQYMNGFAQTKQSPVRRRSASQNDGIFERSDSPAGSESVEPLETD